MLAIAAVSAAGQGTLAAYVVLPEQILAPAPVAIPLTATAGLPLAGLTGRKALIQRYPPTGQQLLVTEGAGAMEGIPVALTVDSGLVVDGIVQSSAAQALRA